MFTQTMQAYVINIMSQRRWLSATGLVKKKTGKAVPTKPSVPKRRMTAISAKVTQNSHISAMPPSRKKRANTTEDGPSMSLVKPASVAKSSAVLCVSRQADLYKEDALNEQVSEGNAWQDHFMNYRGLTDMVQCTQVDRCCSGDVRMGSDDDTSLDQFLGNIEASLGSNGL
jgi:hypothetical protein